MLGTLLMYGTVIALLSFALISASMYVGEVGDILNTIWYFITDNLLGFLLLVVAAIAIVFFIKRLSDPRSKRGEDYTKYQEGKINYYEAKAKKSEYLSTRETDRIAAYNLKKTRLAAKDGYKNFKSARRKEKINSLKTKIVMPKVVLKNKRNNSSQLKAFKKRGMRIRGGKIK